HAYPGFTGEFYIAHYTNISEMRKGSVAFNGILTGFAVFSAIMLMSSYLVSRTHKGYLYGAAFSMTAAFFSVTTMGEGSLYDVMQSANLNIGTFILRLEYLTTFLGAFFSMGSIIRKNIKTREASVILHFTIAVVSVFWLFAPIYSVTLMRPFQSAVIIFLCAAGAIYIFIRDIIKKQQPLRNIWSVLITFVGITLFIIATSYWYMLGFFVAFMLFNNVIQMSSILAEYKEFAKELSTVNETLNRKIQESTIELQATVLEATKAAETKSTFLATMSHEIRTPMNAIIGMSDLITTENLDEQQKRYLSNIRKMSGSLLQIIDDILDFSKMEAGKLDIVPVNYNIFALLDNIVSMFSFLAQNKSIEFESVIDENIPECLWGDETRIRQILTNLLSNAVKYTKEGRVKFETKVFNEKYIQFIVTDTGIGIKKEDCKKLFISFQRLDAKNNVNIAGTGLGLVIAHKLAKMMRGSISVNSKYGAGSIFTFTMPIYVGDKKAIRTIENSSQFIVQENVWVLVVDDNEINLDVAEGFLKKRGLNVDRASGALQAVSKVQLKHYDIVFMDHMMPEIDGIEAMRMIRALDGEHFKNMPIIALTANAVSGARQKFLEEGMSDFLSKPLDSLKLNEVLAKWLPPEKICRAESFASVKEIKDETDKTSLFKPTALDYFANDEKLYNKVLDSFCRDHAFDAEKIQKCIDSDNISDARLIAHTLKGTAALIGANPLSESAAEIEKSIIEKRNFPDLNQFKILLDETIKTILLLNKRETKKIPDICFPADKTIASEKLTRLISLLKTGNGECLSLVSQLEDVSFFTGKEIINTLEEQIYDLRFSDAIDTTYKILEKFDSIA
ncbi:MAG: response regulator, partial [Clostridiales bacterium]|nr:response regulator [Clostridiales bacterium]